MIVDGGLVPYEVPFEQTYRTATATHETRQGLFVHVATDEGVLGLGEAAPLSNRTESLAEARSSLEAALATLSDHDWSLAEARAGLDELVGDTRAARFGLALALEDAIAKRDERPLAQALADTYPGPEDPLDAVPVNATIPQMPPEQAAKRAQAAREHGIEVLKLKAGRDEFDADVARIEAVHEAAPEATLRVDLNQACSNVDEARRLVERLEAFPLAYVEQPLPADDLEGMARLRNETDVPIAADEPALDPRSARATILARACDVLVVKPMVLGGPDRALQIAELARRELVDVVVTTTIDAAVARAGTLHTAAALGASEHAHGLATGDLLADEPARFDERIEDGAMPVPTDPGHGARRETGETKLRGEEA